MGIKERRKREKGMRRRQIQDAAKEIFFSKGFAAATMEEIAQRQELSVATLYSYFKNKEELYASLNLITLEHLHRQVKKTCADDSLPADAKIMAFKETLYNTFRHDPLCLLNILRVQLDGTLTTFSPELLVELNRLSQETMRMIAGVYEEGIRQKKFPKGPGMQYADIIWGVFAGLVIWEEAKRRLNPQKDFLKPTLDKAFEVLLSGFNSQQQSR